MSHVVWISVDEGAGIETWRIPVDLFGTKLPDLYRFIAAVTSEGASESESESESEEESEDGEEKEASNKRAKRDPIAKAFANRVSATAWMHCQLRELGPLVPESADTGAWPACRVIVSYNF